jgi:hypothetical protein
VCDVRSKTVHQGKRKLRCWTSLGSCGAKQAGLHARVFHACSASNTQPPHQSPSPHGVAAKPYRALASKLAKLTRCDTASSAIAAST